jgi:hypothetical protein
MTAIIWGAAISRFDVSFSQRCVVRQSDCYFGRRRCFEVPVNVLMGIC